MFQLPQYNAPFHAERPDFNRPNVGLIVSGSVAAEQVYEKSVASHMSQAITSKIGLSNCVTCGKREHLHCDVVPNIPH